MTGWEVADLIHALKLTTKEPDEAVLIRFCKDYHPLCALAANRFIVIRPFKVNYWQDERRIMNAEPTPEDEKQWGMTIVNQDGSSGSMFSVALPNHLQYHAIELDEHANIVLSVSEDNSEIFTIATNVKEVQCKLKRIYGLATDAEIAAAFDRLSNESYQPVQQIKVTHQTFQHPILGELTYQADIECYQACYRIDEQDIVIYLKWVEECKLTDFINEVAHKLQNNYYLQAMQAMLIPLLILKNGYWLTENETLLTVEQLKVHIAIMNIIFYFDGSSVIDCHDGGLFAGHSIIVDLDKDGTFLDVNIAG